MIAAAMCGVLVAVTVGGAYLGAAVIARHRAQASADLAALAAAASLAGGAATACALATELAAATGTTVVACSVQDLDAVVTVEAAIRLRAFGMGAARAVARAGPGTPSG
ncbi:Rv3654c family TadE-like protein [Mycolicibacterium aurum]|uniref:Rv3654c family TadE-like protein n=1 Tax=Mycolicibacterium aurum TaxID=1791 RepID=UPI00065E0A8F|nr:Rv3654c family TadE-like protein [Mycolicibacterium aurum]